MTLATVDRATRRPARSPRRITDRPQLVLGLILAVQLMVVLDASIVNIALQDIRQALHFSPAGLSWVVNAYTLTFGGLLLLGARSGDLLGRRRTFLAGLTVFTLASLAGGLAQTSGELLAARAVQGIGGALASPSALALLMTMFPGGRERTRAIGLYTAVSIGGATVGLIAGGMLTQWASWRWVLFVNVPIGVVAIILGRLALTETERQPGRFDLSGAVTSTLGMVALVYGFVHAATAGWGQAETIGSFVVGAVLLVAFIVVETRAEAPITPLRLFGDRSRNSAYLGRLTLVAGMMGMFFFLTQFLRGVLDYSPLETGFAFLPLTIMVFASSQLSARVLVDRFGRRPVLIAGITVSTLGLLWLTQLTPTSSFAGLLGPLVLFGLGNGTAFVPLTTAALDGVAPEDAGAASGLVNVMQQMGGSLGLAVLVTVFGTTSKHATAPSGASAVEAGRHAFVVGATNAFWAAAAFVALTLVLVAVGIRSNRPEPEVGPVPEPTEMGPAEMGPTATRQPAVAAD